MSQTHATHNLKKNRVSNNGESGLSGLEQSWVKLLREIRVECCAILNCIDFVCEEVLADELCHQLKEASTDSLNDDFITTLEAIREICTEGLVAMRAEFSFGNYQERLDESFSEATSRSAHDLKNLVTRIKYRADDLLEEGDERFLPFEDHVREIQGYCHHFIQRIDDRRFSRPEDRVNESSSTITVTHDTQGRLQIVGNILIVDDEAEKANHLANILRKENHVVTIATSGSAALKLLDNNCYGNDENAIDLVLLDMIMPSMNGYEVLDEMKKDYGLRSIPVVMVSAESDISNIVRCISRGADDYLTKPCDPGLLRARVSSCLTKSQLRKQERILTNQIRQAKQRTDRLLHSIFPYTVAEELVTSGAVKPRGCDQVAVLFCDVAGFTSFCKGRSPDEVVENLHELFSAYENVIEECGVEKIKTIGDCIMVTAGITSRFENPVYSCLKCGHRMIEAAKQCSAQWDVRVGIHIGPVVAGMAGNSQYAFDVWGDTVNTASRIEGTADPGTISVSEPAWSQVFHLCRGRSLGLQALKGRDSMEVFRFEGLR